MFYSAPISESLSLFMNETTSRKQKLEMDRPILKGLNF